jgi:hypothetical protein
MTDIDERLKCPLCEGHGTVTRSRMAALLGDGAWVEDQRASAAEPPLAVGSCRDFQKDVHGWNPELPMWRRSNKE